MKLAVAIFAGEKRCPSSLLFSCSRDGCRFYAGLKVWPLPYGGHTRARAGAEWGRLNHLSVFYLTSPVARLFHNERVTARVKAILHDELAFTRCHFFQDPGECRARVAFGPPELRNGTVYCSIRRCTDPVLCVVQIISRILRHLFVILFEYGHMHLDCVLTIVTLHMQWHPCRGHQALWHCFRAWASEACMPVQRRERAAADIGKPLWL